MKRTNFEITISSFLIYVPRDKNKQTNKTKQKTRQYHSATYIPLRLSGYDAEYTNLSILVDLISDWHQHYNSRKSTRERHGSGAFVACLISS